MAMSMAMIPREPSAATGEPGRGGTIRGVSGRCATHGLAVGPDGGCVLCRRGASGIEAPSDPRRTVAIVAAVFGLFTAGVLAGAFLVSRPPAPIRAVASRPAVATASPIAPAPPVAAPPTRDEVALEPAPTAAPATAAATVAAGLTEEEIRVRDERWHQADLAVARRRVSVTMYASQW